MYIYFGIVVLLTQTSRKNRTEQKRIQHNTTQHNTTQQKHLQVMQFLIDKQKHS